MDKYVLITGGELFNKGAQSMTFVTVNEISKRFPDAKIVLLSSKDYLREKDEKEKYKFEILPINSGLAFQLMGGVYKQLWNVNSIVRKKDDYSEYIPKLKMILKNSIAMVDISGYALSSQFGNGSSIGYLSRILLAKKYNIDVYLMPQSFGPFKYKGIERFFINHLMNKTMNYPKVIYARESEGYDLLKNDLNLSKVKKTYDLVLMNKGINLNNIYREVPVVSNYDGIDGVAIVPNMKNFRHGNKLKVLSMYDAIIKKLTDAGKKIYLVRHSYEDIEACEMIKERCKGNDQVILLTDDMSCLEFDSLVKRFEFIIGSRFHSIVHAYKNAIPCIALGWATKYHELLKIFKQDRFIFDVRNDLNEHVIVEAVEVLLKQHNNEVTIINQSLKSVQREDIYNSLEGSKLEK
ncbi:polysaccharide pyruvyl transferase family protein [Halalkalibacter sp. APA_J-10(15)]|uniref:polysaccharide pyruvyl transferase family protein n=1 Tax=Halalkalibacter sp. APA_J-10(15) TaxID=2933805 RepID=UPI001FF14019|nr:polysaccharide pyruvyl transferase family protein [Halalkalibacter sp. APA_J-10(15)]MCK0470089.1 polysaccharide pyruvyl transferase family protein [Halalkalibacter sp. APA_J-10(15)]